VARKYLAVMLLCVLAVFAPRSHASSIRETILYEFSGATGNYPLGAMVSDKAGNLYGTTLLGGFLSGSCAPFGCGVVFELSPPTSPGAPWTQSVIYAFQGGSDGSRPACTLVIDRNGNLFGTSVDTPMGEALVWELSPPAQQGLAWLFNSLYDVPSSNGLGELYFTYGNLIMDKKGNLYGTARSGGTGCQPDGCGFIYEVSPPQESGGAWAGMIIFEFPGGSNGAYPSASLAMDTNGALYGGAYGTSDGLIFQLTPPSVLGDPWQENVLLTFSGTYDGVSDGLIFDKSGNLYGASPDGGANNCAPDYQGCGFVFELSPPLQQGNPWTETVLYNFQGFDGSLPIGTPILDTKGNLYGTTDYGGANGAGTFYELIAPGNSGGSWTERKFSLGNTGIIDSNPVGSLMFGPGRALTGTTPGGFTGGAVVTVGVQ
jgi:uncharacterized repeat protein (TIGR03803 family)